MGCEGSAVRTDAADDGARGCNEDTSNPIARVLGRSKTGSRPDGPPRTPGRAQLRA